MMSKSNERFSTNGGCPMGENCCKKIPIAEPTEVFNSREFCPYDPSQEIIFPPKLHVNYLFNINLILIYLILIFRFDKLNKLFFRFLSI